MWAVSASFNDAVINGGVTWVVRAHVHQQGNPIPGGTDIPILGGDVAVDKFASVRRRLSMQIAPDDPKWIPEVASDLLFPVGREIMVEVGFRYADGTEELVPQGVFRISKPRINDNGTDVVLAVEGYDRSRAVSRARFTEPYVIPNGTNYATAIRNVVQRALPWFNDSMYSFMATELTTPQLIFDTSDDPWKMCEEMASSIGAEVFFDMQGRCVLRPEPVASEGVIPVWTYTAGEDATLIEVDKDLDDEQAYNGVIVTGTNSSTGTPPVRAEAWDEDPQSPTYYSPSNPESSLYGPVPFFIESQFITTQNQAEQAAQGNLAKVIGVLERVDFSAVPNPAHEVGDVVALVRERMKVNVVNLVDGFRVPLTIGATMQFTTRDRRIT